MENKLTQKQADQVHATNRKVCHLKSKWLQPTIQDVIILSPPFLV